MAQKIAVVKITASKNKGEFDSSSKTLLRSKDNYRLASNPFYKFIYEEVKKMRGEQENEESNY